MVPTAAGLRPWKLKVRSTLSDCGLVTWAPPGWPATARAVAAPTSSASRQAPSASSTNAPLGDGPRVRWNQTHPIPDLEHPRRHLLFVLPTAPDSICATSCSEPRRARANRAVGRRSPQRPDSLRLRYGRRQRQMKPFVPADESGQRRRRPRTADASANRARGLGSRAPGSGTRQWRRVDVLWCGEHTTIPEVSRRHGRRLPHAKPPRRSRRGHRAPAAGGRPGRPGLHQEEVHHDLTRKISLTAGVFYLLTFVSIPTLILYGAVRGADYIVGSGPDTQRVMAGLLEIDRGPRRHRHRGRAVPGGQAAEPGVRTGLRHHPDPGGRHHLRRRRQPAVGRDPATGRRRSGSARHRPDAGRPVSLDVRSRTGLLPAVNAVLLGTLLYKSRLVPRVLPLLGFVGRALLVASTMATLFGANEYGSAASGLVATPDRGVGVLAGRLPDRQGLQGGRSAEARLRLEAGVRRSPDSPPAAPQSELRPAAVSRRARPGDAIHAYRRQTVDVNVAVGTAYASGRVRRSRDGWRGSRRSTRSATAVSTGSPGSGMSSPRSRARPASATPASPS